jgi:thiol:disulfide interchange protein
MAKLHQTGYIACLIMAVWVVVLHESVLGVKAYIPVWTVSRSDVRSVTLQRSAVSFGSTDDSEWYSPPPAPKMAVMPRPSASKPLQTDVTTVQELARVLNDADDRLIIIKFYASW